jgi:hypothetical protein
MAKGRRRLTGPAAISALAAASLMAPAAAQAQEECLPGQCETTGPPGLTNAFIKISELGFPGKTDFAFQKVGGQNAFKKLGELGFPGKTGDIFFGKFSSP